MHKHTLNIEGVVIEEPTAEVISSLFPELSDEYISQIMASFLNDSSSPDGVFNESHARRTEMRAEVNRWRDAQFKLPVTFTFQGRTFKASLSYINILKSYQDFLPDDAVWTDESDGDLGLTADSVSALLQAMQEAMSTAFSSIHAEARERKRLIDEQLG